LSGSGLRLVFVIEDDEAVLASTRTLLEASGFVVRTFANAEELLAAGTAKEAGCIVLDYHLSGITGIELMEALRAEGLRTPAIIVTSNGTQLGVQAAKASITAVQGGLSGEDLKEWLNRISPKTH
jgi:FixJ family two-component response regulator